MRNNEYDRLKHRRQYIIAPQEITVPFLYESLKLNNDYMLYYHVDLIVNHASGINSKIVVLGDMFDYEHPEKDNSEILKDLSTLDFNFILEKAANYAGRFVIIFVENQHIRVFHDIAAARKVYYCKMSNNLWLASRPSLLAHLLNLEQTKDNSKIAFYKSPDFYRLNNSNIGNTTIYDDIFQLMPNHFLDFNNGKPSRYWPNIRIEYLPFTQVAEKCAEVIKGHMKSIVNRYPVMLPVTAGKDSRLLLSATKDYRDKVFYYVNKESNLNYESNDIAIPKRLLGKLGLDFHILECEETIDHEFEKIYFENNDTATTRYLHIIYNYYKNFSEKVNLPGNFASAGLALFKRTRFHFSGETIAKLFKLQQYDYAGKYFSQWLSGCQEECSKYNVDLRNLVYWEERLPNWGSQVQLDKDIAQEEINPFNSRILAVLFLSVKPKYIKPPNFKLYYEITRLLWPDVLKIPTNPSANKTIEKILAYLGLLNIINAVRGR